VKNIVKLLKLISGLEKSSWPQVYDCKLRIRRRKRERERE
jgi:hypothetical protein